MSGNFAFRSWIASNSVDQFISGDVSGFINSKQSLTMVEMISNYWFGFITQNQLSSWGPLFGVGVNFAYGKSSFTNLQSTQGLTADLVTYMLDFDFAKLALLHNDDMNQFLALLVNYSSYSNSLSGSNPLNGLGVGIDAQYNFDNISDLFFRFSYIPNANSTRISNAWGANSELGLRWFVSPKAAINVGYKALYYTGKASGQTTATDAEGKQVNLNVDIKVDDILHGITIGGSYFF